MVKTAHEKGIYVMADVVANHVAPVGEDYSTVVPFNKSEYFHPRCQINDWNNQNEVETCRLADLPDLNQGNAFVRQYLKTWVKK
jgi:alpha-amylase